MSDPVRGKFVFVIKFVFVFAQLLGSESEALSIISCQMSDTVGGDFVFESVIEFVFVSVIEFVFVSVIQSVFVFASAGERRE